MKSWMKKWRGILALVVMAAWPPDVTDALAQQPQLAAPGATRVVSRRIEPPRVATGVMRGKTISLQPGAGRAGYEYSLTGAQLVSGRLQFRGPLARGRNQPNAAPSIVSATLVGTMARSNNPWPGAGNYPPSRRLTNPNAQAPGQSQASAAAGQNPSSSSAADTGTGCEVMFLKLPLPEGNARRLTQAGVVLAHRDNQLGQEINQSVCRIVRALEAKQTGEAVANELARLNRLLAQAK
jgi:hypothetical protein